MKLFILFLIMSVGTSYAFSARSKKVKKPKFRKYSEKVYFNYFMQFLGPSLSPEFQNGATYNRFKTGQAPNGEEYDFRGSHQVYHALTMGIRLSNDYLLNYAYTFQDDLNKGIKYTDEFGNEQIRPKGVSDNNKRINFLILNVVNNDYFYINTNYFYEISSTINSGIFQDMQYGLGFEPSINFYNHSNPNLYLGMNFLFQRNYYKNNEVLLNETDQFKTKYQTFLVEFSPYLNYKIDDYWMFKSKLQFDWDQRGDQVNSTSEYNANMHDVGRVAIEANIDYGVHAGVFLEFALTDPELDRTALGLTLNFSLY